MIWFRVIWWLVVVVVVVVCYVNLFNLFGLFDSILCVGNGTLTSNVNVSREQSTFRLKLVETYTEKLEFLNC